MRKHRPAITAAKLWEIRRRPVWIALAPDATGKITVRAANPAAQAEFDRLWKEQDQ